MAILKVKSLLNHLKASVNINYFLELRIPSSYKNSIYLKLV